MGRPFNILDKIRCKLTGRDPFYYEVKAREVVAYQRHFEKVIASVDLITQTKWALGKPYDKARMEVDDATMERLIAVEAAGIGLAPSILQIMVNQFYFADIHEREADKDKWVERVLNRKSVDYFPTGWAVWKAIQ